jgi:hypothetical protein
VKTDSSLSSTLSWLNKGAPAVPSPLYGSWYAELANTVNATMGAMLTKQTTPKGFVDTVQGKADEIKSNASIPKFHR